jgi:hypothetical protein
MQWRTIDGVALDPLGQFVELETLIRGLLNPATLLDYLRFFVLFEDDGINRPRSIDSLQALAYSYLYLYVTIYEIINIMRYQTLAVVYFSIFSGGECRLPAVKIASLPWLAIAPTPPLVCLRRP